MFQNLINIRYHGSELLVVPAVHFRHGFATEVNRICSHPNTRPEAIAVELGNKSASAVGGWLKELLPEQKKVQKPLPVMLGLMKHNRLIRASYKQKAFHLQQKTGCDLSELSPEGTKRL